jgi:hypothetical protein
MREKPETNQKASASQNARTLPGDNETTMRCHRQLEEAAEQAAAEAIRTGEGNAPRGGEFERGAFCSQELKRIARREGKDYELGRKAGREMFAPITKSEGSAPSVETKYDSLLEAIKAGSESAMWEVAQIIKERDELLAALKSLDDKFDEIRKRAVAISQFALGDVATTGRIAIKRAIAKAEGSKS